MSDNNSQDEWNESKIKKFYQEFFYYCFKGNLLKVTDFLAEYKFNIDAIDISGNTGLMYACIQNHTDVALLLINKGANINIINKDEKTCLYYSTYHNNFSLTCKLLTEGKSAGELLKTLNTKTTANFKYNILLSRNHERNL